MMLMFIIKIAIKKFVPNSLFVLNSVPKKIFVLKKSDDKKLFINFIISNYKLDKYATKSF